jgi:hypothetical protein
MFKRISLVARRVAFAVPLGLICSYSPAAWQADNPQGNHTPVKRVVVKAPKGVSRDPAPIREDEKRYPKPKPPENELTQILMPMEKYKALKAAASSNKTRSRPPTAVPIVAEHFVLDASHNFDGRSENAGVPPPDTHGAASDTQYAEVTNSQIDVFDKASGALLLENELASIYGANTFITDTRVLHDPYWDRWVLVSVGYPLPGQVQPLLLAVSKTGDATGAYWAYKFEANFNGNNGALDYPELGMDQDSIIITGNRLNGTGADLIAIAKAGLYSNSAFEIADFQGLQTTLAPPVVRDQNPITYLIAAPEESSVLYLYALTNSSRPAAAQVSSPVEVPVEQYTVAPNSPQLNTCGNDPRSHIETLDSRFENASTQVGRFLYQTHTINAGGLATPVYYKIDTVSNSVVETGAFFASATSHDFNASIAADSFGNIYVTWTSIDLAANRNADVRFAGKRAAAAGGLGHGTPVFTSTGCLTLAFDSNFGYQRWGDYSSVFVDTRGVAWFVNEDIVAGGHWGSRIGEMVWKEVPGP